MLHHNLVVLSRFRDNCKPEERMLRCDYENDFHSYEDNDDDDNDSNGGCGCQRNDKEDISLNINESSIIEDVQVEINKSDDFWNTIASEKSWEDLSISSNSKKGPGFGTSKEDGQRCTAHRDTNKY